MLCYVRLMCPEDVSPVTNIDREAFPTQLPPPNYQHELRNQLAHYIVACDGEKPVDPPPPQTNTPPETTRIGLASRWQRLMRCKRSPNNEPNSPDRHDIVGFVGFWIMAEEAHITSIAVREACRRRGIGELLLISAIDMATELKAHIVTLEARASNFGAQGLYAKYSFTRTGVRHGYYTDNREDAIVMTTPDITLAPFQAQLQQLKQTYSQKWGIALPPIVR